MSRSMIVGAAVLALATYLPLTSAAANGTDPSIMVSGKFRVIRTEAAHDMGTVTEFVDHAAVDTSGLDLRDKASQTKLEQRVRRAAYAACDEATLDQLTADLEVGAARDCATAAIKQAQPEVRQAISAAKAA